MAGFNIGRDPWVPVITGGVATTVSAGEALESAHEIDGLDAHDPLVMMATLRLLVAMAMRVDPCETTARWQARWDQGRLDPDMVKAFLRQAEDRLELFDSRRPFMQVAGLQPGNGDPKPAMALDLAAATGNNVPLFSSRTEAHDEPIPPAEALRRMLVFQGYDTAGIKPGLAGDPEVKSGKTTGNRTGLLGYLGGVLLLGRTLFETIMLNVPLVPAVPQDRAVWERDVTAVWETRQPRGPLELLTWQSRRMRLVPNEDHTAVTGVVFGAGDRVDFIPPQWEPHTRWQATKKGDVVAQRPMRWPAGRPSWRSLDSLLAVKDGGERQTSLLLRQVAASRLPLDYPLGVACVGVSYGNQSAVIEDVYADVLPLPVRALTDESGAMAEALTEVATCAGEVRDALNFLDSNIRRAVGAEPIDWKVGVHPGDDALPLLDEPTRRLLSGLQREPEKLDEGLEAWQRTVGRIAWRVAEGLLDKAPLAAYRGRTKEINKTSRTYTVHGAQATFAGALAKALPRFSKEGV